MSLASQGWQHELLIVHLDLGRESLHVSLYRNIMVAFLLRKANLQGELSWAVVSSEEYTCLKTCLENLQSFPSHMQKLLCMHGSMLVRM